MQGGKLRKNSDGSIDRVNSPFNMIPMKKKTPRARLYFNNVIDEVILGPSFKEDDIKRVKDELNERGHERIKVSLSKVKLRK